MAQTTIQGSFLGDATVTGAKIGADFISAQTELTTTLATADEIIVSDAGVIKRIDISVWSASTETLTNKSIDLGTNTLTGSIAEFNTALQSESFATLGGTETLVAKTLTTPTITSTGWTNATHAHGANNSGGTLNASVLGAGTLPAARIAGDSIVEGKLNVSNGPTNGQVLTARDGVAGGFTWEAAGGARSVAGDTDNGLMTWVTSDNTFAAESTLTYNGTELAITGTSYLQCSLQIGNVAADRHLHISDAGAEVAMTLENNAQKFKIGVYDFGTGDDQLFIHAHQGGVDALKISGTGNVTIPVGNVVIGTAGKGIDFSVNGSTSATGAAMASELLDDYEEGTFTPFLHDWSFDSSEATHSSQVGRYQKIGRWVYFWGYVSWSSIGTLATGSQGLIGGLPYTSMAGTNYNASVHIGNAYGLGLPSAGDSPCATINANTAYMSFHVWSLTAGSQVCNFSQWGPNPTANFAFAGSYETNS